MRRLIVCAMAVGLCGCSSFKAVKLDGVGTIGAKDGVPMMLPKPEFVVKKVDGTDSQYQVAVGYVPDPRQRYAVRLSSTPLAQIDFSLVLSETGSLTSTSGEVKDQIAPTALALFKVAASAATTVATGGMFSKHTPVTMQECFVPSDLPSIAYRTQCAITVAGLKTGSKCKVAGPAIVARLQPYVGEKNGDKDGAASSLFARDTDEGDCFKQVSDDISQLLELSPEVPGTHAPYDPDVLAAAFAEAFKASNSVPLPQGAPPATVDTAADAITNAVSDAIKSGNVATIKRLFYSADDVRAPEGLERFKKLLGDGADSVKLTDADRLKNVLKDQALDPVEADLAGLNKVAAIAGVKSVKDAVDAVAKLTPVTWKSRYLTALQKSVPELEKEVVSAKLQRNSATEATARKALADVRADMADLAGVSREYARLQQFSIILDRMPSTPVGEKISPAAEYDQIGKEAASLETSINTAIATAMAGDAKPKPAAPLPLRTPWVSMSCVTNSKGKSEKDERWRYLIGYDSPDFVVVLRRADGTTLEPIAEEVSKCGA